jgi:hypothetical protein
MTFDDSAFAAEISVLATEPIAKSKRVVKNKIQITKPIDHNGRIRQGDKSGRLISLNVEMLAPGVERWGEHTAFLPFERLLRAAFGPNAGRTPSLDHINQLFEKIALRQRLALRLNFTRITITTAAGAHQVDKGT